MTGRQVMKTTLLGLAVGVLVTGCIMPGQKPRLGSGKLSDCKGGGLIDDLEDGNNQGAVVEGRGGYWYTYADPAGTTVTPAGGGPFPMTAGGANDSKFAANMKGKLARASVVFAAMGVNLTDPRDAYDATAYKGFSFRAKKGPGSTGKVRFKVPDSKTDGEMGDCTDCNNDFGMDINVTDKWTKFTIPFNKMQQMVGWGAPRPPRIDASAIFALHWQVYTSGADFDISVDDIQFIGCE